MDAGEALLHALKYEEVGGDAIRIRTAVVHSLEAGLRPPEGFQLVEERQTRGSDQPRVGARAYGLAPCRCKRLWVRGAACGQAADQGSGLLVLGGLGERWASAKELLTQVRESRGQPRPEAMGDPA